MVLRKRRHTSDIFLKHLPASARLDAMFTTRPILPTGEMLRTVAALVVVGAFSAIVHLPVVLPPVVTGYLLLLLLSRRFWFGAMLDSFGLQIPFRVKLDPTRRKDGAAVRGEDVPVV